MFKNTSVICQNKEPVYIKLGLTYYQTFVY